MLIGMSLSDLTDGDLCRQRWANLIEDNRQPEMDRLEVAKAALHRLHERNVDISERGNWHPVQAFCKRTCC